ncbi:glucose-6-phosphate isomerase [Halomonas sp. S2151]|uniref:Glucose-6-phosphate isomerase n=3 Tax=Halomonas TaxID=2745 RepID=A0AAU7KK88_9GAMM|nr:MULTISPECIES: glucose-6-phosphate isomerase [Halomonas]MBR9771683.1 glucose-6-phosphate isomerase [Gammaproteobacteria bacterium]KJZ12569.1 glucose-6-phosphate isomerase [Halomonas sp. S2151]MAR73125.1 glucose-6-phosphate isomerase [Halomonas sp.]MBR9880062.1 glucose-6-phosphate isomerase [Gammaproteobacteria bacterium]MBY5939538.1 glucose-6-phosphate isomerase [Halomonas sp. DP5N14-9]
MFQLTRSVTWQSLLKLRDETADDRIRDYFAKDPKRFDKMSLRVGGLFLDYSKHQISDAVLEKLVELAEHSALVQRRAQMFSGDIINVTEDRPVLHTALRNLGDSPVIADGKDVMPEIHATREQIKRFSEEVRSGNWKGYSGERIRDVVNIGIGGSDLGPNMASRALLKYRQADLNFHFVSNVDGAHIQKVLSRLDPATTLFIVSTKTFSTQETLLNARTARRWFVENAGDDADIGAHFIAASTNRKAAMEFGIREENVFEFWAWVGGRYSMWSSIGLPIALAIGYEGFIEMLEGAYEMDQHFQNAPLGENMPVLMALIGIWYINFVGAETQAIVPYDQALHQLPAFLQQLDMESNGKSVDIFGRPVDYKTGPIVWGQTGSNGQHAFFQLLHQGTRYVPIDFIASLKPEPGVEDHHFALLTNMLAQANAFMEGSSKGGDLDPYSCPGNRPSSVLLLDELTPRNLGALIALYEHKVFVQGVIWNINSFDQWGVQLGKRIAGEISEKIDERSQDFDASTQGLLGLVREHFQAPGKSVEKAAEKAAKKTAKPAGKDAKAK